MEVVAYFFNLFFEKITKFFSFFQMQQVLRKLWAFKFSKILSFFAWP